MRVLVRLFPLLVLTISSCALHDNPTNIKTKFEGFYQGTISSQDSVSPYTLDIVIDELGDYLGTLNNLDANSEIIMRCHYGEEATMGECMAVNIFQSQVFKLYGIATQFKYQGDFEYFERGIKEFEGDFVFVR